MCKPIPSEERMDTALMNMEAGPLQLTSVKLVSNPCFLLAPVSSATSPVKVYLAELLF